MNTNSIVCIIFFIFSILTFSSCESHEQKTDEAFENVKEEKNLRQDSDSIAGLLIKDDKKIAPEKSNEKPDEWIQFKSEIENKIVANERKIKQIKSTPNTNAILLVKVAHLEQKNNDLRKQMDEYQEEVKLKWEKFQLEMKQDVNTINEDLRAISAGDKK